MEEFEGEPSTCITPSLTEEPEVEVIFVCFSHGETEVLGYVGKVVI